MGSLALRPGGSLTILLDGFVNRLQDFQFPSFLLFKLRGLNFYPDGTFTHCSCQPSLDAHFSLANLMCPQNPRQPVNGVVVKNLTEHRLGQGEALIQVTVVLFRLVR